MPDQGIAVSFDEKRIDALFAPLDQCHLPGAAVGIAIGGRVVYRKGFGLINMEQSAVLSPGTRMRIFSVSKHFTSLAYMLLCEEGRAGIDEEIGRYLPELPSAARHVTARQLMGNISGLHDVFDVAWLICGTGWSLASEELLALYNQFDGVNAAPSSAWIYNNGGFLALSIAIERIAGRSLEEVFRVRIFERIGMNDTMLRRFDTDFVPNSATLHMTHPAGGYLKSSIGGAIAGEGGIVSTVDDMLRWLAHMDAPVVGNAATWAAMTAPQRLTNGVSTGYGMGLIVDRYRGVEALYHSGGALGGSSQMIKIGAASLDVIVMVNREDVLAPSLADGILAECLPALTEFTPRSFSLAGGTFNSPTTGRTVQLLEKAGQQIASMDGTDIPMAHDSDGVLWPSGHHQYKKLGIALIGNPVSPSSIQVSDFGNIDELFLEPPPQIRELGPAEGRYALAALQSEATIWATGDGTRLVIRGSFGSATYRLECIGDRLWRAQSTTVSWLGGVLKFDAAADTFRLASHRTTALTFRRMN